MAQNGAFAEEISPLGSVNNKGYKSKTKQRPGWFLGIAGNAGNHENDGKFHESYKILNHI